MSLPVLPEGPIVASQPAEGDVAASQLFQARVVKFVQAWSVHGQLHALQIFMMLSTLVMMFYNAVAGEQIYQLVMEAPNDNQTSTLRLRIMEDLSLETLGCLEILSQTLDGLKLSVESMALFRFMMSTAFFAPGYFFKELDQTLNKAHREAEMIKFLLEGLLGGPVRAAWEGVIAKLLSMGRVPRQAQENLLEDVEETFWPYIEGGRTSMPTLSPGRGQKLEFSLRIVRHDPVELQQRRGERHYQRRKNAITFLQGSGYLLTAAQREARKADEAQVDTYAKLEDIDRSTKEANLKYLMDRVFGEDKGMHLGREIVMFL